MNKPTDVTDATFDREVLQAEKPVIVDFWAEWCGPCRALAPILDQIAHEHRDTLFVVKMNVDENPATTSRFGITSIPALKVYQDGQVTQTILGAKPKATLEALLGDVLAIHP